MEVTILNQAKNWDYWTDKLKDELKNSGSNKVVGEHLAFENNIIKVWTIFI